VIVAFTISLILANMLAAYVSSRTTKKIWIPKNTQFMRDLALNIFCVITQRHTQNHVNIIRSRPTPYHPSI